MKLLKRFGFALILAAFILGLSLNLLTAQASPNLARTSVRGLWGLFPETISSTGAQTITPTNSRYLLAPATALTVTLSTTGFVNGDQVVFVNTVATDTIFADTGAIPGATTKTLDEDADRIAFEFDGAEWVMTSFTDQSNAGGVGGAGSFTTLSTTGNGDIGGTLNYGSDNLYPLGYASSGYEIECGTTAVFTGSTTVTASALTTVTVPLALQVTAPTTTATYLHASDPTTSTVTLTSLESDFTAGTTGIQVHYCLVGNQ